jgi:PIN domain nuclease of toxin-antitoxin system
MRYLLDTHTLIWYLEGAPRLPKKTKEFMDNNADHICLCAVSQWERGNVTILLGYLHADFFFFAHPIQ